MKKISKIKLEAGIEILSGSEMKMVVGGYGYIDLSGCFYSCHCKSGANAPFNSSWSDFYKDIEAVNAVASKICINGDASCSKSLCSY